MASLLVEGESLVVRMNRWEKIGACRGDVTVPVASVTGVRVSDSPWRELRGWRAPGTGCPGVIALCTLRGKGYKDFAAVYRRRPVVIVELSGAEFARLIVTVDHPEGVAEGITSVLAGDARA